MSPKSSPEDKPENDGKDNPDKKEGETDSSNQGKNEYQPVKIIMEKLNQKRVKKMKVKILRLEHHKHLLKWQLNKKQQL
ncbi:hypothetical protein [Mycoplasmopsis cynos]|uniref:hypothetical protein n=1 Tax=Mycoplasmopsis cynos TaxID=171284 RepID=UPI0021FD4AD6|nr:hypothetical protein [Mycoplasmopsis cynos]UWV82027.1 hypothetical protein NW065_03035 [Mycoplasmopsis cynos]